MPNVRAAYTVDRQPAPLRRRAPAGEQGFSLVEIMVVLVILGVVSTGIATVFISGQQEYGVRESTIRMQQQARQAMTSLERDLKMTGYGLTEVGNLTINRYRSGATVPEVMGLIAAEDGGSGGGPDTVTVSFQNPSLPTDVSQNVVTTVDYTSSKPNNLRVSSVDGFSTGDIFLIYDPSNPIKPASMLQVTNIPGSDKMLNHNTNSYNPPNSVELFPPGGYPLGCRVLNYNTFDIRRVRYSVDATESLIREEWLPASTSPQRRMVAAGIQDLQVRYQFADGRWLDAPVSGDATHDIDNVRAIRVSIIARTASPDIRYDSTQTFQLTGANGNGRAYSGGHYRRMTMSTTFSLRNLAMRSSP